MIPFVISCLCFLFLWGYFSFKRRHPQMIGVFASFHRSLWTFISVLWLGKHSFSKLGNLADAEGRVSLLDLPELSLDCILGRLSPVELCRMSVVCSNLRDKCGSDHLWERHIKQKWGRVIGNAASREWRQHIASKKEVARRFELSSYKPSRWWPSSLISTNIPRECRIKNSSDLDSIKHLYLSLENGLFLFPAQVYNREHGHDGFVLSCYDARLTYDRKTDAFRARYPPYRRLGIEDNIPWSRLRSPPVETNSYNLHVSDCLYYLKPGDRVEIQWRRIKAFSYGWWYGEVGHLEPCDGNQKTCCCTSKDKIVIEFKQYAAGSRWRRAMIDRWKHREVGDQTDGFYGGVRRVCKEEEMTWSRFWPEGVLE